MGGPPGGERSTHQDGCHDQERPGRVHRAWPAGAGWRHRGPTRPGRHPSPSPCRPPCPPRAFGLAQLRPRTLAMGGPPGGERSTHQDGCHDQERPGRVHRAWPAGAGWRHRGPTRPGRHPSPSPCRPPCPPRAFGLAQLRPRTLAMGGPPGGERSTHQDGCHDQERPGRVHRAWPAGAGWRHRGPTTRTKTPQAGENLSPLSPHDFGLSPHPCGDKITYVNQWLRWFFSVCPHCPHKKKGETQARAAILSGSPPL